MNERQERERERISGVVSPCGSLFGNVEDQKLGNRKYFYPNIHSNSRLYRLIRL